MSLQPSDVPSREGIQSAIDAITPAQGSTLITTSSAAVGSIGVTFPDGKFATPPHVFVTNVGGSGSTQFYLVAGSVTTTGFTVYAYQRDATAVTANINVHWLAFPA